MKREHGYWRRARRTTQVAVAFLALPSCGDERTPATCVRPSLVLALSDASSSGFAALPTEGATRTVYGIELGRDATLAGPEGAPSLLARLEDRLFPIDLTCGGLGPSTATKSSAGTLGNPQDVTTTADGTRWVTLLNRPAILALAAGSGATLAEIDLSTLDDDKNPNAGAITSVTTPSGERLLVALERLDDAASNPSDYLQSTRPSSVALVDPISRAVVETAELAGRNPFGPFVKVGGELWTASLGSVRRADEVDAGIVAIDPSSLASRVVFDERALGGSPSAIAIAADTAAGRCGAAIVLGPYPDNATSLVTFDAEKRTIVTPKELSPLATPDFSLTSIAFQGGTLFVGDKRKRDGGFALHAFALSESCTLEAKGVRATFPLPPVAVRVVR